MDPSAIKVRLRDDLRGQFRGELLLDPTSLALYATDASLFRVEPLAVAVPRDEADLALLVRYAYEHSIPLVPRGAGTGVAGAALSHGVVVDLSVHFRSIIETGDDWVRVQSGVVLDRLNARLRISGRRFAPEPACGRNSTIGGMIATNASGPHAAKRGHTRDHVLALRVVWDDGTADSIGRSGESMAERTQAIRTAVHDLMQGNKGVVASSDDNNLNRCGYALPRNGDFQSTGLVPLLVGSEGTLGAITEARLRTVPLPGGRAAAQFGFASFEAALHAGLTIRESRPAACAVLDRRLLSLARARSAHLASLSAEVEAALFVEFEHESTMGASDAVQALISPLHDIQRSSLQFMPAYDDAAIDEFARISSAALPTPFALGRGRRPLAFVDDIAVPPDALPEFVTRANAILKRLDITSSFVVHVATGHVDLRPFLDPDDAGDAARLWPVAEELHSLALDLGGTVSARRGIGIARTPWMARQYGPLLPVVQELKRVFDPRGILNPGKIVGPDPSRPAWPLRPPIVWLDVVATAGDSSIADTPVPAPRTITPLLIWRPGELTGAVASCNGCGECRSEDPALRMCPTFRATHTELAAPRAKANLFRSLLENKLEDADERDLRAVAELCVNCKMCATECPSNVDIPKLMLEAKAANHEAFGFRRSTWMLARIDGLASMGSKFALTANFLLRRPTLRWALERVFGLSRRRTLPAFSFRTFLGRARRRGLTRRSGSTPGVAYFVDTYANLFDPSVAEATVAVLRHNGIPVYVPPRQRGSGAMALAHGDVEVARERLAYNVRRLADCARNGDTIVCSEPTAALFFRLDALGLLDDSDVRLVAERTVEASAYLWSLHEQERLRTDFQQLDMQIGHHVPCHVKALGKGVHGPALLSLIPGLAVNKIDVSCSGMAGTYGLNARNLPISMAAGGPMIDEFSRPENSYGSSECSACRLQMQEGAKKRALHPVQYLALAYGLMPSIADRLRRPFGGRVSI